MACPKYSGLHTTALPPRGLRTAAMQGPWAAHGSPLRGVVGRAIPWREAGGWAYGDGPLEDLVFLNNCNLLVFLGWAKIVAI